MTQREQLDDVIGRLSSGKMSMGDAQRIVDALSSWADKRLPNDNWDEVLQLERILFGSNLSEEQA